MSITATTAKLPNLPLVTARTDAKIKPGLVSPVRIRRAIDSADRAVKILVYGDTGTGKTRTILGLLAEGLKVLYFSTEIGGSGALTVELEAAPNELERFWEVEGILDYETLVRFLRRPETLVPEIYEIDPDVIFWDGLSEGQLVFLEEYIGEDIHSKREQEESDARRSGLQLETRDWSMVMNGTVRMAKDFLLMYNVKTGRPWSKVATCKEVEKERIEDPANPNAPPKYKQKNTMLIHGAAKKLIEGGFDLILRTRVKTSALKPSDREFLYCTAATETQTAKSRGIVLPTEMPADFRMVWRTVKEALDKKRR